MYHVQCAEVWGGITDTIRDLTTPRLTSRVHSAASHGGRGGDIYYVTVCETDRIIRIVIADVLGHGTDVSDVSQRLYTVLARRISDARSVVILRDLNRLAFRCGYRCLTTAAIVTFDAHEAMFYVSYAGHPPVLHKKGGDRRWHPVTVRSTRPRTNLPLGAVVDATYEQTAVAADRGDRLFLYTDGLTESANSTGAQFGDARFAQVLTRAGAQTLPDLTQTVLGAAQRHASHRFGLDDVTIIAAEIT